MSTIVEVAFNGNATDSVTKKMARLFAYDNRGFSISDMSLRLGENEGSVWNALLRLKNDLKVVEASMDHSDPVSAGGKTRTENKFRIKAEYIHELKAIVIRQDGIS